jgi:hypothetical protein
MGVQHLGVLEDVVKQMYLSNGANCKTKEEAIRSIKGNSREIQNTSLNQMVQIRKEKEE